MPGTDAICRPTGLTTISRLPSTWSIATAAQVAGADQQQRHLGLAIGTRGACPTRLPGRTAR
jgi:hypothetical protein